MKEILSGKRNLASRIIAILLSIVMVLSVLYVSNKDGGVSADEPGNEDVITCTAPTITVSGKSAVDTDSKTITLKFYHAVNVNFTSANIRLAGEATEEGTELLVTYEYDDNYYTSESDLAEAISLNETTANANIYIYVSESAIEESTDLRPVVTLQLHYNSDVDSLKQANADFSTENSELTISTTYRASLVDEGGIIDASGATAEYYYGRLQYGTVLQSEDGTPNNWQADSTFSLPDGTYIPYIRYMIGETVLFDAPQDPVVCDSQPPEITEISLAGNEGSKGTVESDNRTVTGAYITDTYTVNFTVDEDATVYLKKNEAQIDIRENVVAGATITMEIPALASSSEAENPVIYDLVAEDAFGNARTYAISITYLTGEISITNVKINDNTVVEDGSVAVKKQEDGSLKVTASITSGDITLSSVKLYDADDSGNKTGVPKAFTETEGIYEVDLSSLTDGTYTYIIEAVNAYGEEEDYKFTLVSDNAAPDVTVKLKKTAADPESDITLGEKLDGKLSTIKNADASITLDIKDAWSNIVSVKIFAKIGENKGTETPIVETASSKEFEETINLSDFHAGLENQIKGATVSYYAVIEDEAGNSTGELLIFEADYYKDYLEVTDVKVDNFSRNPIGETFEAANVVAGFTKDGETGTLTNAISYEVTFKVTSDIELSASNIKLFADDEELAITASLTPEEQDADGNYVYTGTFVPSSRFTDETVTYKVVATNINGVTAEDTATVLFIDVNPAAAEYDSETHDTENDMGDESTPEIWYRNLTVVYRVTDEAKTGSISSGVKTVEVSWDGGNSFPYVSEKADGLYPVKVAESGDKNGTKVSLRITDEAGNISYYPSADSYDIYHVDNTPPTVSLSVKVNGSEVENNDKISGAPTFEYGLSDNLYLEGEVTISYNNEWEITICTTPEEDGWTEKSVSSGAIFLKTLLENEGKELLDGKYTVTITARDTMGENAPVQKTLTFEIDNTEPEITTVLVKENGAAEFTRYTLDEFKAYLDQINRNQRNCPTSLTIRLVATDSSSGNVSKISVAQNGGAATTFEGNRTGDIIITPSVRVSGTPVHVEVYDTNINSNNKSVYDWNILVDDQPPVVGLLVDDPAYENNDSVIKGDPGIKATDSDNIIVNARSMTITAPNGTVIHRDASYLNGKKLSELLGRTPEEGTYTIRVTATDRAGVSDAKTLSFTIDNTAPGNQMKITTAAPAKMNKYSRTSYDGSTYGQYYNTNVTLNYSVSDDNLKSVTVSDNGNVISRNASGNVVISAEGVHTITLNSVDKAGNRGTTRSFTFTIDKTAPVINTTLNGSTYTNNSGIRYLRSDGTLTATVTEDNKDTDDFTRIEKVTPPSQATQTNTAKIAEGTKIYSTEADYEIVFVAVDRAGNVSIERVVQFRVDKHAPELTISGVADGGTSTKSVTVTYGMKEDFYWDMVSAKINIYKSIDGQAERLLKTVEYTAKNANSTMSETFSEDGDYRFEFIAEDKAGNTAQKSYSFILDGTAPVITLSGVKNYDKTDEKVTMEVIVTEDFYTSNQLTFSGTVTTPDGKTKAVKFGAYSVNSARVTNILQQFTEDGVYDIEVTSKDKAGNTTTERIHFTIDTSAPIIADLSEYDGTVMREFVWDLTYDDIVSDLTVCDIVVYLDGIEYDGLNDVEDGRHVLRIVATDELGHTVEKQYEFLLDTIAPNVIITGVEDGDRLLESTEISVSLQIDGDILDSVTVNGESKTITDNVSTFTVDKAGSYEMVIKAHDEAGNMTEKVIHFEYGKQFNFWWIILIAFLLLLLITIIILIAKKKKQA